MSKSIWAERFVLEHGEQSGSSVSHGLLCHSCIYSYLAIEQMEIWWSSVHLRKNCHAFAWTYMTTDQRPTLQSDTNSPDSIDRSSETSATDTPSTRGPNRPGKRKQTPTTSLTLDALTHDDDGRLWVETNPRLRARLVSKNFHVLQ